MFREICEVKEERITNKVEQPAYLRIKPESPITDEEADEIWKQAFREAGWDL